MFADHPLLKPFSNLEPNAFPAEAIRQVIVHQQEMTPLLLDALKDFAEDAEGYSEEEGNCLHLVALTVLAQFRETAVFPILMDIVTTFDPKDWDTDAGYEELICALPEEAVARILASVMATDIGKLQAIVTDKTLEIDFRCRALEALKSCYIEGDMERSDLTAFLSGLFREFKSEHLETDILPLWMTLYDQCLDIHPQEMMDDIRDACETGFLGDEVNGRTLERAKTYCKEMPEQSLSSNRKQLIEEFGYIREADKELESWGMNRVFDFDGMLDEISASLSVRAEQRALQNEVISNAHRQLFHESANVPFTREEVKVGRNDPCPCGSGKKFKKCCG